MFFNWLAHATERPTLAQQAPQNLWEFLSDFPKSFEAQLLVGLIIAGLIGMSAHYALKWARGEIKQNPFCYIICNGRSTFLSFCTYIGVAIGLIVGGAFVGEYGGFVGWKFVFWTGITNGFAIDAIVNKTNRARWTVHERITKRKAKAHEL